jgi:hypothetical protein
MGGGSRGGPFSSSRSPQQLASLVRKAEDATSIAEFEAKLSGILGELLATCNDRDVEQVQKRLEQIKVAIADKIDGSVDHLFGGSVAKHTYVDGLSDIDSILFVNGTKLSSALPQKSLEVIADALRRKLSNSAKVSISKWGQTPFTSGSPLASKWRSASKWGQTLFTSGSPLIGI